MPVFPPEVLTNALVIDSEGFIYGRVEGIEVKEDDLLIKVYEEKGLEREEVDYEKLLQILFNEYARRKRGFRRPKLEDFYKEVRRTLGIPEKESIKTEDLIEYTKQIGLKIKIPKKSIRRVKKYVKGLVSVKEIRSIALTRLPQESGGVKDYTIILLKTPRQAEYSGNFPPEKPPYLPPEKIKNMLVIRPDAKILGYADNLLIGAGIVGLRVKIPPIYKRVLNLRVFIEDLQANYPDKPFISNISGLRSYLKRHHLRESADHVDVSSIPVLESWMKK